MTNLLKALMTMAIIIASISSAHAVNYLKVTASGGNYSNTSNRWLGLEIVTTAPSSNDVHYYGQDTLITPRYYYRSSSGCCTYASQSYKNLTTFYVAGVPDSINLTEPDGTVTTLSVGDSSLALSDPMIYLPDGLYLAVGKYSVRNGSNPDDERAYIAAARGKYVKSCIKGYTNATSNHEQGALVMSSTIQIAQYWQGSNLSGITCGLYVVKSGSLTHVVGM